MLLHCCLLSGIHFSHPPPAHFLPLLVFLWVGPDRPLPVLSAVFFPFLSSGSFGVCKTQNQSLQNPTLVATLGRKSQDNLR